MNQISLCDQIQNHRHHLSDEHPELYHSVGPPSPREIGDQSSLPRPPLENGERIVWISDTGPELGTVRWIGILPDSRIMEYTIGVEFVSIGFFDTDLLVVPVGVVLVCIVRICDLFLLFLFFSCM